MSSSDTTAQPGYPVPILTYHNIGATPAATSHPGLHLSLEKFRFHLDVLGRHGYRGISMTKGLRYLTGQEQGRVAIITFDDGYVDTLEQALPELQHRGFSATCYVVASHLGDVNAWDSDVVGVRKPLMDLHQVRQWLAAGMDVGSHTLSHPHLSQLDYAAKQREIIESRAILEDRLGTPVEHFCFPYGDYDEPCIRIAAEAGYSTAVTTRRGRVRRGARLLELSRIGNRGTRGRWIFQARALLWELPL